jgi:Capsule polysaccharide biosynthesis protein
MKPLRICIYAFSSTALFFRALLEECEKHGDDIEWSIIYPQGHFRHVMDDVIPPERQCYLYEDFARAYRECGEADIQRAMASGEGLQTALLKDKAGYRLLNGDDQLRRGATIDSCYRRFLSRIKPDFVLFPDLEVVDGFILMNIAQELGLGVLYFSNLRVLGGGYFSTDSYETLPPYFGNYTAQDLALAQRIIGNFLDGRPVDRGRAYQPNTPPKPSWLRRLVLTPWLRWKYERFHATEENLLMRIKRNMRPLMGKLRLARFDLTQAHYFHVKSVHDSLPEKYILYLAHVTPESSINGLAPYFVDQFRGIDALLLHLPNGHRLVVKEHPAMRGSRRSAFYREMRCRPGLVMVHPTVDTRHLMKHAAVIATITGSVGLEAFLLDKPCLSFGPNLLCQTPPVFGDLKAALTDLATRWTPPSDAQKEIEFAKLLNVSAKFVISDPWLSGTIMAAENVEAAREYLWLHLRRLETLEETRRAFAQ